MTFKLFTSKNCAYCPSVKKLLDTKKVDYETVDVTDSYESRLELQQKYGALTVPVLVREDEQFAVGMNVAKIMSLI
jgi:glutaredoxin